MRVVLWSVDGDPDSGIHRLVWLHSSDRNGISNHLKLQIDTQRRYLSSRLEGASSTSYDVLAQLFSVSPVKIPTCLSRGSQNGGV